MEAALRVLIDRFASDGNPDALTMAAFVRTMRVCRAWHDVLHREEAFWRCVVTQHLVLHRCAPSMRAVAEHVRMRTRCLECGRSNARLCRITHHSPDLVAVCTRCSDDELGFRRMVDRQTAIKMARHASNGFRRKGRNITKICQTLVVARRTRCGHGVKMLYWAHAVTQECRVPPSSSMA